MPITHSKVSAIPDSGDSSLVRPSDWNAGHVVDSLSIDAGDDLVTSPAPRQILVVEGTTAAPITVAGPTMRIVRYEELDAGQMPNPVASDRNAGLHIYSWGTPDDTAMVCGIHAQARGGGTTEWADVLAVSAIGEMSNAGGTHGAAGIYAEGRRDYDTASVVSGGEIRLNNQTATAGVLSTSQASDTMGLWLTAGGTAVAAAGLQLGYVESGRWLNGLVFNQGAITTAAIRDDSNAVTSIDINGSHTTGIDLSGGTYSGAAILTPNVKFPATQVASSDANTLDDYEEGTWTPALTIGTPGDLSVTYTVQEGTYTKVGRQVIAQFRIIAATWTHSTASGALTITGLPFAIATGTYPIGVINLWGYTWAGIDGLVLYPGATASTLIINANISGTTGGQQLWHDKVPSGTPPTLLGSISYFV